MVYEPELLTLVRWAERLAAGERCEQWEAWCAAAPDAASKWERVIQAQELLAGRYPGMDEGPALSVDELAAFADGGLTPQDAQRVEQACWQSTEQLAELFSAVRFAGFAVTIGVSQTLEQRLLALAAPPAPPSVNGDQLKYRLAGIDPALRNGKPATLPTQRESRSPEPAPAPLPRHDELRQPAMSHWPLVAAAALVAVALSGAVGWLAATWRHAALDRSAVARGGVDEPLENLPPPELSIPPTVTRVEPVPEQALEQPRETAPPKAVAATPTVPEPSPLPLPPKGSPKHRPPLAAPTATLAFESPQGLMLADVGMSGAWRAIGKTHALAEPLKVLSLAESWTTVDVPGVGRLVFAGDVEAALATTAEGKVEVQLTHGRLGVENLLPGAELRVVTGDAAWTTRGVGDVSSLAVVADPASSGLVVPRGAVSIDDMEIREGQIVRWQDGVPQPAQPVAGAAAQGSLTTAVAPPAVNPWDLSWLTPPSEDSQKQWRTTYGRLAERLAAADDAGAELAKVYAATREPRQAALLARWSLAANASSRSDQTWTMLMDRRAAVRAAAVRSLLEMPPADPRRAEALSMLREKLGAVTAKRVDQWLLSAWQPGPPPAAQASEIVEHLQHGELAVRQMAVSMLELHTAAVLRQLGHVTPAYDAAAPPSRRATGYADWKSVMVHLYTPGQKQPMPLDAAQQRRALNAGKAVP